MNAQATPVVIVKTQPAPCESDNKFSAPAKTKTQRKAKRLQAELDNAAHVVDLIDDAQRKAARQPQEAAARQRKHAELQAKRQQQAAARAAKRQQAEQSRISETIAAVMAADTSNQQRISTYGSLSSSVERLLDKQPDATVERLLSALYAGIVPQTEEQQLRSDVFKRRAQVLNATVGRWNKGAAGSIPRFPVCYISLDKKACTANVIVMANPTEEALRTRMAGDTKSLNAYLGKMAAPSIKPASDKPEPERQPEQLEPSKHAPQGGIAGALRELVAGWRVAELRSGAALLLELAEAGEKALADAKARKVEEARKALEALEAAPVDEVA